MGERTPIAPMSAPTYDSNLRGSTTPSANPLADSMSWSPLEPEAPWAAYGSGFAPISNLGTGLLFGGISSSGLEGMSAIYNESNNTWTSLTASPAPSPRSDFGLAADPSASGIAVLFGGLLNLTTNQTGSDTWVFSFLNSTWFNASRSSGPAARQDPAFAIDPANGVALLYGGWSANAGGTGEITYSDSWELNLSTHDWTRVALGGPSPGPIRGAALLWQPTLNAFLLFGGCYPCSSAVWEFTPSSGSWSEVDVAGAVPEARMNAVWSWDPAVGVDVLFGGTNGTGTFGDTRYFDPVAAEWTSTSLSPSPGARWDATGGFLNATNNATIFLTGGTSGGLPFEDTWRLAQVASLSVLLTNATSGLALPGEPVSIGAAVLTTNLTGYVSESLLPATEVSVSVNIPGYAARSISLWLAPNSSLNLTLAVRPLAQSTIVISVIGVDDSAVEGAFVNVTEGGHLLPGSPRQTNANGDVEFRSVPSGNATINVQDPAYRNNTTRLYLPPGIATYLTVVLTALSLLLIHVVGNGPSGTVGLQEVPVTASKFLIGLTNSYGWLNTTTSDEGSVTFRTSAYGFLPGQKTVVVAPTGLTGVNLTLAAEPYPRIIVEVLGRSIGNAQVLLKDAAVNVTNVGFLPTGRYFGNFTTGTNGTVTFFPPVGNYTLRASAPGYQENSTGPVLTALSGQQYVRQIYLQPIGYSNLTVLVESTTPLHPAIPGATVVLNFTTLNLTDGQPYAPMVKIGTVFGWSNFSGVPAATTVVTANAVGYYSNSSTLVLQFNPHGFTWTMYLKPLPPAPYAGLRILPADTLTLWTLAFVPVAAVLGVLVYLTMLRTPSMRERDAERSSAKKTPGLPPPR
jgi:hypothetical protein